MNTTQKLILAGGVALLIILALFPYTSYSVKEQGADAKSVRSTVRWGFQPIWVTFAESEKATMPGNPFDDWMIAWPATLGIALIVVIATVVAYARAGAPSEKPSRASGAT